MIRLTAQKTYRILYFILSHRKFTQTEIHKATGVSIGRVNRVVSWLLDRGYVEKTRAKYKLTSAVSLISLLANFRAMKKTITLDIDAPREEAVKFLVEKGAVFCLTSALQHYDTYFRDPSICVYSYDKKVIEEFKKFRKGNLRINIYEPDLCLEENITTRDSANLTSEVRTIIDLFCDNKSYAADRLIKRVFA
jgi:DNA-binding MarR family transcriptional regulator